MNTSLVLAVESASLGAAVSLPRPRLVHCLLLAALLHLWLVALVGTTPGGSAEPGDGVWSSIQIRLSGVGPADSPGRAETPLPYSGPVGRAPEPRFGGTVRDAPAQPSPEPGAAELGVWNARTQPSPPNSPPGSPPARPVVPADAVPLSTPPTVLTRPQPQAAPRREDPTLPTAAAPSLPEPVARPAPEATPAPSTAPRLAPVDTVEAPALDRPPQTLRDITNAAPTPSTAARPQPAPAPQPAERPTQPTPVLPRALPPPPVRPLPLPLSDAAAPLAAPVPVSVPPTIAPATSLPQPPVVASPLPAPPAAVAVQTPPRSEPVPPPDTTAAAPLPSGLAVEPRIPARELPRLAPLSPVDLGQTPRAATPDVSLPPVRAQDPIATTAVPATTPAGVAGPSAPVRDSLLPAVPPVAGSGQPNAGPRLGPDRATGPSAAASSAPLNLELPRARATLPGLVAPRVLNLVPPPPDRKSALTEGIEKAAKPDCRKAYSGLGPLAVVPLAADALRDGGCRW